MPGPIGTSLRAWSVLALLAALCACSAGGGSRSGGAAGGAAPVPAPPGAFFSTASGQPIVADWTAVGREVRYGGRLFGVRGVSWFGLETTDRAPHGLWAGRSADAFLLQIASLGLTAVRIPISPEAIRPGFATAGWSQAQGYPADARAGLEHLIERARAHDLAVLLDLHTFDPQRIGGALPGRPFEPGTAYDKAAWLDDVRECARLALAHPNVLGIDLCNEPHALTWTEWASLAEEAGAAALAENACLLIFVEGVGSASPTGGYGVYWGENLVSAATRPLDPRLVPSHKLVYSPHVYGFDVFVQAYFQDQAFPRNMPAIWDAHFGHLAASGETVLVGELGSKYEPGAPDRIWGDALVDYLDRGDFAGFFFWSWNPNSGDTGGLLQADWRTPEIDKLIWIDPLFD